MLRPDQLVWIASLGFLLGIALGTHYLIAILAVILAGALLLVIALLKPGPIVQIIIWSGIFLLFGWWRGNSIILLRPHLQTFNGSSQTVTGQVVSDPEIIGNQQRFQLITSAVDDRPIALKLLVTSWHLPAFHYSDQISGDIKISQPSNNPEFSYANYLAKDNIFFTATQAGDLVLIEPAHFTIMGGLYQIKHWLNQTIHQFLPEPHAGLLAGLLLGMRTDLSDDFKTALKNSGTSHIVALSGFNVTVIITFLLLMLRRLPRRLVWALSGILILAFVVMTGAASSVVRAAIMGWLLLLSSFWGRRRNAINAVLLAMVTMVLIHPQILVYDVGFQLSVAATLGLIYCSPLFSWRIKYIPQELLEAFSSTLGATIFTLPLIALYFGGLSRVALLANLLVVPLVPYVMLVGFAGVMLFTIWPKLSWLVILVWPLSALLLAIINWFGHLPSAFINLSSLPTWIPLGYYLVLAVIIFHFRSRHHAPTLV